jgi:hypothetical protein
MIGSRKDPSRFGFAYAALPDEPRFTLLARDPDFARLVREWAKRRIDDVNCGERPLADLAQVEEAHDIADAGEEWRRENPGKWRVPEAAP